MSKDSEKSITQLILLLRYVAAIFVSVGTFLVTKGYFSDIIFIDSDTDMMLGVSLIFVGIIDYFVVPVFLKRGLKK